MEIELTIEQRVHAILRAELGRRSDAIFSEANIARDLGADSMDVHSLVIALEDEFNIEIPDRDLGELQTVRNVVHYVAARAGPITGGSKFFISNG